MRFADAHRDQLLRDRFETGDHSVVLNSKMMPPAPGVSLNLTYWPMRRTILPEEKSRNTDAAHDADGALGAGRTSPTLNHHARE